MIDISPCHVAPATHLRRAMRAAMRRSLATHARRVVPELPASCRWAPCPLAARTDAPVALVFGWTSSTQKQLGHYARVFHAIGLDAVTWACPPGEVVRPARSLDAAARLVEALHAPPLADRPLVFNGISAGAYSCGNLLEAAARLGAGADFGGRVAAAVYDSPVDFEGVPVGVASAVFGEGTALARGARRAVEAYLGLVDTAAWEAASARFHEMAPRAPSVWIYSESDVISRVATNEAIIAKWRARGDDFQALVLAESPHVKHMLTDPAAYHRAVHGRVGTNYLLDADVVPVVAAAPAAAAARKPRVARLEEAAL